MKALESGRAQFSAAEQRRYAQSPLSVEEVLSLGLTRIDKRAITADTGPRLSRFFGMSEDFWIGLQADYDRGTAKDAMAKIKPWRKGDSLADERT